MQFVSAHEAAASLEELREYAGLPDDDSFAQGALESAFQRIEGVDALGGQWWSAATLRATWPHGSYYARDRLILPGGALTSARPALFALYDGETVRQSNASPVVTVFGSYNVAEPPFDASTSPGGRLVCDYSVGTTPVPDPVKKATLVLAAHYHAHRGTETPPDWTYLRSILQPVLPTWADA